MKNVKEETTQQLRTKRITKKEWNFPALEIIMRAFYGIALITGIVILNVKSIVAFNIVHKISAVLFLASIIVLVTSKLLTAKKS